MLLISKCIARNRGSSHITDIARYCQVSHELTYTKQPDKRHRLQYTCAWFQYLIRRLIVRSRKVACLYVRIALKFYRHVGSSALDVHVKLQSDRTILYKISRGRDFARSCNNGSFLVSSVRRRPSKMILIRQAQTLQFNSLIHSRLRLASLLQDFSWNYCQRNMLQVIFSDYFVK